MISDRALCDSQASMTTDQLREFVRRQPFEPFTIHLADGSSFKISHPETLVLPHGWSSSALVTFPKDRFSFLYLKNITHVSSRGNPPNIAQRKRRNGDEGEE